MMFDIENIYCANSINQALNALANDEDSLIIAGGSDVLIKIREGKLAGKRFVSINSISELSGISLDRSDNIIIKPLTTFSQITKNEIICNNIPVLAHAVDQIGGPQIRNMGTIGGNICNGVTSADSASTLFALNAELEITGIGGTRIQKIQDFYVGAGKVSLAHGEILTAIIIKKQEYEEFGGHYIKYAMRNAMDIATLGCAVVCKTDGEVLSDIRIAFGVCAPVPMRCYETEKTVIGSKIDEKLYETVAHGVLKEITPRTSWRASKEFRMQLASVLSARALKQAISNAQAVI